MSNFWGAVHDLDKSVGANEGNRTPDLLITNELLYQLSYIGLAKNYIRACGGLRGTRELHRSLRDCRQLEQMHFERFKG